MTLSEQDSAVVASDQPEAALRVFGLQSAEGPEVAHMVPVAAIHPGKPIRARGLDEDHVALLTEVENDLPAILVHRQSMQIIDGAHRFAAALRKGERLIAVRFFHGSYADAFVAGVEANVTHGLPLLLSDRKNAAAQILADKPELSDRACAHIAGLSKATVAKIRASSGWESQRADKRVGNDGRIRPLNSNEGRSQAAQLLREQPTASLRDIANQTGLSSSTVSDVRKRLAAGRDPTVSNRGTASRLDNDTERQEQLAADTGKSHAAGNEGGHTNARNSKEEIIARLSHDPSVIGKESGRDLLRLLGRHAISMSDVPENSGEIPPHRRPLVALLARRSAAAWMELLKLMED
jgi:hypothetical protein